MFFLGGSLIGELDYTETFELYYFFGKKVFFKGCSFTPSPFLFAKNLRRENFKKWKNYWNEKIKIICHKKFFL